MSRLDRTQFEENKWADLIDKFIDKNPQVWIDFVDNEYQSYLENDGEAERQAELDREEKMMEKGQ